MFSVVPFTTFSGVYNGKEKMPRDSERKMIRQTDGMILGKQQRFLRVSGSHTAVKHTAEGNAIPHYGSRRLWGNGSNEKEADSENESVGIWIQ